jgi:LysR family transcriptional regulator (chromosome initiation inhibitor)
MINYESLSALEAVIRLGSFHKAARELHITQSAVSQRIRLLEDYCGTPLLSRTAPLKATSLGVRLINHTRLVQGMESELLITGKASAGISRYSTLNVGVNADSLATWFLKAVAPLLKKQRILLNLIIENEFLAYELLQRGEVLGCVSAREQALPGCERVRLGVMKYQCVATKSFIKKFFSKGFIKSSIQKAPTILFDLNDHAFDQFLRKSFGFKSLSYPHHTMPSSEGLFEAILADAGYGLVPTLQALPYLKKKRLVDITPNKCFNVALYWHYPRMETQTQKSLRSFMTESANQILG